MLILSHDQVVEALPPEDCARAMAEVLAAGAHGETYMPLRMMVRPPSASGLMGLMPAWRGEAADEPSVFSLKAICLIRDNPARGLDAHQGVVALFDGEIGIPLAILDASAVTAVRTAAVSAVATAALAREDARVLAIIGAGVQARSHVKALLRVRKFEQVRVYAPSRDHAHAVIESIEHAPAAGPLTAEAVATAHHAVDGADVVVTATSSPTPVVELDWLAPGTHVNAVGASTPAARELTPETVAACALFADSRESIRNEAGEFLAAIEQGLIGEDHVRAELGEVLAGLRPGRQNDEEITLFRSLGLAIEDLAAAQHAVRAAARLGLGTEVHL
jgi:ornithine cyclodeaminase/alanine dehydrogenase-like protein (mu-crystallin family)